MHFVPNLHHRRFLTVLTATSAVLAATIVSSHAQQQIVLTPSSVIGGSGSWGGNQRWDSGQFSAAWLFDNQTAGSAIDESDNSYLDSNGGYWLGKDGDFQEFVTIDLGQNYDLSSIVLYNTHNATFNDRGTRDFQVYGSDTLTRIPFSFQDPTIEPGSSGAYNLTNETLLLSQTLSYQVNDNTAAPELTAQEFFFTPGTNFRYLRINTLNGYPVNTPGATGLNGVGLNEVKIFQRSAAVVPESSTLALIVPALGLVGTMIAGRRRRSTQQ